MTDSKLIRSRIEKNRLRNDTDVNRPLMRAIATEDMVSTNFKTKKGSKATSPQRVKCPVRRYFAITANLLGT